ncbi:unnamed protein product [Schistosoma curassoni]|uniref:Uncharacterized protein n=1 Tax=Schistosoma curassoni TaxID=6186 RepID=A0A183KZW4_9TREM|nr:unnamed protein product [Schistosoma curassoni]
MVLWLSLEILHDTHLKYLCSNVVKQMEFDLDP